jgi:hypothetical protein
MASLPFRYIMVQNSELVPHVGPATKLACNGEGEEHHAMKT